MSSSRRTGAEINILAMLDGHTRKPRRFPGLPRAAWYGGGGVLACALVATVAWLLHDQAGSGFEGRVPAGPPMVALELGPETLPNPALHVDPPRTHGAAVMNVADVTGPATATTSAAQQPQSDALVLDEAHQAASALPAVMAAAVPVAVSAAVPSAAPAAVAAAVPVGAPAVGAPAARPVVHAAPRVLSRAAAPASRNATAEARREASAHPRRTATVSRPRHAPAAVDTDVALISAIIQHVNQRGELKDAAGCGDKPCAAKMTNRP